jgi:hypothetical protein
VREKERETKKEKKKERKSWREEMHLGKEREREARCGVHIYASHLKSFFKEEKVFSSLFTFNGTNLSWTLDLTRSGPPN